MNRIGIILVGAVLVAGAATSTWAIAVALLAVAMATVNLIGGFVVTDRMLEMFKGKQPAVSGRAPKSVDGSIEDEEPK